MAKVFVSYSRKDINFVRKLAGELQKSDLDLWIDWEDIPPTVDWQKEIEKGIEEADIFLFLLSHDSAISPNCEKEANHALQNGKKIIPIVVGEYRSEDTLIHLGHLNYIFFDKAIDPIEQNASLDDNAYFNQALEKLKTAIRTDYEWVATLRGLQVKALEWDRKKRDKSLLLRGTQLQDAESQLRLNQSKDQKPTPIQIAFIDKSRKFANLNFRIGLITAVIAAITFAALAIWGWGQAGLATLNANESRKNELTAQAASTLAFNNAATSQANEQIAQAASTLAYNNAVISRAGELAAKSEAIREKNFPISLLLAIEAFNTRDTAQSKGTLLDNAYANPHLRQYIFSSKSIVTSVAYGPDGTTLAFANMDGDIHILNAVQYTEIKSIKAHTQSILKLEFNPAGSILASASKDATIRLWDTATYQPTGQALTGHSGAVTSLAFSADGKTLASGSEDQTIILWNVQSQLPEDQISLDNSGPIIDIAFSQDDNIIIAAAGNKVITLNTQDDSRSILNVNSEIYDIALKPNSDLIAIATCGRTADNGFCTQGKVIIYDINGQKTIGQPLIGHSDYVRRVAFSPDGKILASGSWDRSIILWDMESLLPLTQPLYGHTSFLNSIAFSPNGKSFATGGGDQAVIFWDVKPHQPIGEQFELGHDAASLAVTGDGRYFAAGSNIGLVSLWDRKTNPPTNIPLNGHARTFVNGIAFSPDEKILATGSHDLSIRLWDVETGQPIGNPLLGHTELVDALAFSPDGKTLASGSWDDSVKLWDLSDPNKPANIGTFVGSGEDVTSVAFSPDGTILASAYKGRDVENDLHENYKIILWDMATQQQIGDPFVGHTDAINDVVFSPDGKYLFSASYDKTIIQWEVASHNIVGRFLGPTDLVFLVAVSGDGTMLASGGSDKKVILWDIATHQPIGQPLELHNTAVNSATFIENDKTLVTSSVDGTVIFWSLEPTVWIQKICERVGRNFTPTEWTQYFHPPDEEFHKTCPQWDLGTPLSATSQP